MSRARGALVLLCCDRTITDEEEGASGIDGFLTSPISADTDGDTWNDAHEIANGFDPTDPSSAPLGVLSLPTVKYIIPALPITVEAPAP